jgi:hypothetical protein
MPDQPEQPKEGDHYPKPRPKDEPPSVVKARELIEGKLEEMFESYAADEAGNYVLGMESARVFVVPTWIEEDTTVIRIFAITNLDVPVTAGLSSWLLARNLEFVFGAFALDVENGAVWFNHNLLGDFADPAELEASIAAVAQTADRYDDEIKSSFGGRLYVEAPASAQPTPPTPGYL